MNGERILDEEEEEKEEKRRQTMETSVWGMR